MFADLLEEARREYELLLKELPAKEDTSLHSLINYSLAIQRQIDKYIYSIRSLNSELDSLPSSIAWEINSSGRANQILIKNIQIALKMNREFNDTVFSTGLMKAAIDPNSVRIFSEGPGVFHVDVNFNQTAGSIVNYASAVKVVRDMLASKKYEKSGPGRPFTMSKPEVASMFWEKMFYGSAREGRKVGRRKFNRKTKKYFERDVTNEDVEKYWWTILQRLELSGKPAPYWEILDKGSSVMDGGGKPYPRSVAMNFTGKTVMEVQALLEYTYREQHDILTKQIFNLQFQLTLLRRDLEEVNKMILRLQDPEITVDESSSASEFYRRIISRTERTGIQVSQEKLQEAMEAIRSGNIEGLNITSEGRIELTAPGSSRRFRISIRRIISGFEV
jgi:hypothetical protein